MENILSQFNADNLEIKLTSEKLFINTITSNETFALRSVNGIGVIDLVDEYNKALTAWKKTVPGTYVLMGMGALMSIAGVFGEKIEPTTILLGFAVAIGGYFLMMNSEKKKPNLMSAVRIMMSGGNRDFQFDKTGITSGNIAEFVAKVESTLTSYHKNND
jgi:hypothetical protein